MTGKEMVRAFKDEGWVLDHVKGSHHIMKKGKLTATIPVHGGKDLKKGTQQALLKLLEGKKTV